MPFRFRQTVLPVLAIAFLAGCAPQAPPAPTPAPKPSSPQPAPAVSPAAAAPSVSPAVPSPSAIASPGALSRTSLQYGVSVFVWGHPETTDRDLGAAVNAGLMWQKSLFEWRAIEPTRGQFDWREADRVVKATNARGLKLLARLDFQPKWARKDGRAENGAPDNPQDFADFVSALATRYRPGSPNGELQAIEIWNEPNLEREWGSPISQASAADYVKLLSAAYQAAKAANPSLVVVTAGLSPTGWDDQTARPDTSYMRWLFDAGMAGHYDALGVHANAQAPDPTAAPGSLPGFGDASFYFRRVEQLRAIQEAAGQSAKPIWVLEFGWTSDKVHPDYAWYAVSEEQKAANIVTAFQWALAHWQPWIGPMMLWTLPDPSWTPQDEQYWWAIADPDGMPRPAITRLAEARKDGTLP